MADHPLYSVGSRPILFPLDEAPVWNSPVFVPTARVRRKDQTLLSETVRQAVSDRWGPGTVFDWNPDGAVWDLVPDAEGRYSRHFPPTPVIPYGRDWPESLDPGSRNRRGSRNFGTVPFGTAARFGGSTGPSTATAKSPLMPVNIPTPALTSPESGTPLIPAGTTQQAQMAARRVIERVTPRRTQAPVVHQGTSGLVVAGAAVIAFGAGVLLGSWLKAI